MDLSFFYRIYLAPSKNQDNPSEVHERKKCRWNNKEYEGSGMENL